MSASLTAGRQFSIPSVPAAGTAAKLFAGGLAGLALWEIWGRVIAPMVMGGPLEPQGLVMALAGSLFGLTLPGAAATAVHIAIGVIGYPIAYWVVSRGFRRWAPVFDAAIWLGFTLFMVSLVAAGKASGTAFALWSLVTVLSATRLVNRNEVLANALSWGNFTWFNALGIMAPIAGMPFLLIGAADLLSLMSWAGHVIYGATAVLVFELWTRNKSA